MIHPVERFPAGTTAADLERLDRPAIVSGGCADWPATHWTVASLAARFGEAPVRAKVSSGHQHPDFHRSTLAEMFAVRPCTFADLLARISGPDPERWLFTGDEQPLLRRRDGAIQLDPHLAGLLEDAPIAALAPPDRLYTVWAWFSGRGVRTWLHYDNNGCHNLNAQLTGSKEAVLFPPSELARMEPFALGGPNPAANCCAVDVDRPDEHPALADAERWTAEIAAGDLLFIPAWWLHSFRHTGALNCNLNAWWKPERPSMNEVAARQVLIDAAARAGVRDPDVLARLERAVRPV